MKKHLLKICLCVVLCAVIAITVISTMKLQKEKTQIKKINNQIIEAKKDKENIFTDNENYKNEIEALKIELKDKLEEEEIWNETIEKLNQALSS